MCTRMVRETAVDFEREWLNAKKQVMACCLRATRNDADAEDLVQTVAIRAWRGYTSFRGDASFITWVLAIARREIARFYASRKVDPLQETSEATADKALLIWQPELPGNPPGWLIGAVNDALVAKALAETEARIILGRLASERLSWEQLGQQYNLDATTCAVIHCRAIPKLRVFLFVYRPELLGGLNCLDKAFTAALAAENIPLTKEEAEVFRQVVLDGNRKYRRTGLPSLLRAACAKVIKYLP